MIHNIEKAIEYEKLVGLLLKIQYLKAKIKNKHSHGIDIIFKLDCQEIHIEVKSCQEKIKSGKTIRNGQFWLRDKDFDSDLICIILPFKNYIGFVKASFLKEWININYEYKDYYKISWKKFPYNLCNNLNFYLSHYCFNKSGICRMNFKLCPYVRMKIPNIYLKLWN